MTPSFLRLAGCPSVAVVNCPILVRQLSPLWLDPRSPVSSQYSLSSITYWNRMFPQLIFITDLLCCSHHFVPIWLEPKLSAPGASQVVLVVKNPHANARDKKDVGSNPGLGRSPRGGHGNLLQYSCLEKPMDRAWRSYSLWGCRVGHECNDLARTHCCWDRRYTAVLPTATVVSTAFPLNLFLFCGATINVQHCVNLRGTTVLIWYISMLQYDDLPSSAHTSITWHNCHFFVCVVKAFKT